MDLCAGALECEYNKTFFDRNKNDCYIPNSTELTVRHDLTSDETRSTPGTTREVFPERFLQISGLSDGTDTDHYMEPDAQASSEQPNPTGQTP